MNGVDAVVRRIGKPMLMVDDLRGNFPEVACIVFPKSESI
jgi:hypothetical protein